MLSNLNSTLWLYKWTQCTHPLNICIRVIGKAQNLKNNLLRRNLSTFPCFKVYLDAIKFDFLTNFLYKIFEKDFGWWGWWCWKLIWIIFFGKIISLVYFYRWSTEVVIYIIISVRSGTFWSPLVGIGRAIARWNRLDVKMMDRWEFFASRALCARSTRKCVPFTT